MKPGLGQFTEILAMSSIRSLAIALGVSAALVSCGGGEVQVVDPYKASSPQLAEAQGSLEVHIRDAMGDYVAGATLTVLNSQSKVLFTDVDTYGISTLRNLPGTVTVTADHALGTSRVEGVRIKGGEKNVLNVTLESARPVTAALFPVRIPAGGINAARTELQLEVTLVASGAASFTLNDGAPNRVTPLLSLENCTVWLASPAEMPTCRDDRGGPASLVSYDYQRSSAPLLAPERLPWAAMLMIELSERWCDGDRRSFCKIGGKVLLGESQTESTLATIVSVPVGLVKPDAKIPGSEILVPNAANLSKLWLGQVTSPYDAISMLLDPEYWCCWVGSSGPDDRRLQPQSLQAMAETVAEPVSLLNGLATAYRLTRDSAPPGRQRAVVAMVGGGDSSGLSDAQVEMASTALRQQQDAAAIKTILVAGRLDEDSPERVKLADLASALDAPLIIEGHPRNWTNSKYDGMHAAMTLATDLLNGASLPTVRAVFRLRTDASRPFQSGALLRGRLWIESDWCAMGCNWLPLDFTARIP